MTTKNSPHDMPVDVERQEQDLAGEHKVRRQKVDTLRDQGMEPWAEMRPTTVNCQEALDLYREDSEPEASLAGRLVSFRLHGKTAFCHVQDWSGRIQVYIRQDVVGDVVFKQLDELYDVGDIVWVHGVIFKTKTGEVTLRADAIQLLTKSLHPLPEKFHGLSDVETKYRQRYLDLISSHESREKFRKRSLLLQTMRNYLEDHQFLEVETPMLHPIPGGAAARPFVTHHNAFDMELFLRIAPELYLKRLVIGGFDRVYEINRCFRNEGVSTRHNPEFTTIEAYIAYHDYEWAMNFVENLLKKIAAALDVDGQVTFGNHSLNFVAPFERMTMYDAVKSYGSFTDADLKEAAIDAQIKRHNVTLEKGAPWGKKLCALFEELVEPHLIQPTFIIDFPIEVSPLARKKADDPRLAARFELYMAGMEICNGFNELNDPFDQAERFREQAAQHEAGDAEAHHYDADYIQALEYGLPPTVGFGIGIDRLVMLLTNTVSIKEVILFPTLKRKHAAE